MYKDSLCPKAELTCTELFYRVSVDCTHCGAGCATVRQDGETPPAEAVAVIGGPDGVALFPQLPNLRLLQVPFTGVDWLEEEMVPAGCTVANVHGMEGPISEYVLTGSKLTRQSLPCISIVHLHV
eukprot:COSAG02_NODE_906_length_16039_cov_4.410289_16_plen_125_part_00